MTDYAKQLHMGLWLGLALLVAGFAAAVGLFSMVKWIAETLA